MNTSALIIPLVGLGTAFVGLIVLTPRLLRDKKQSSVRRNTIEFSCPTCQNVVFITRQSMIAITGAEVALVVQNVPDVPRKHIAEQRCQACSSMLTFRTDQWPPVFVIANAAEGQKISNRCIECRQPLVRPTWPRGVYDEKLEDMEIGTIQPDLNPKLGLKCSRCDAVSCVSCLENFTRNRTQDGSFLCPRCHRSPVNLVHHF